MGIRDGIKELFGSKDDMDYPDNYDHRILTSPYGRSTSIPIMEMRVPLCCDNCEKKVRETLEDMSGVKDVDTDRESNRVTVTGFVDPVKALRRVRKLKPKSELHGNNTYINRTSHAIERLATSPSSETHYISKPLIRTSDDYGRYPERYSDGYSERYPERYPEQYPERHPERYPERHPERHSDRYKYVASPATVLTPIPQQLVRVNSYGRRGPMSRLNSFGRVERYDGRRENELVPLDVNRDFYNIRRMPSLGRHRYHDAEYISMGDEFHPAMAETRYVSAYNQRPSNAIYRSQVSFSKLPVTNPNYLKHVEHEYNY
jgi:copper chaperone CopZ